jgi:hypothetical protein
MSKEEMPNLFRIGELVEAEKAIDFAFKSLRAEWNYDSEFIMKVAKQFECASEGNIFLDQLDAACGDMHEGWVRYCKYRDIEHEIDNNPFIDEDE